MEESMVPTTSASTPASGSVLQAPDGTLLEPQLTRRVVLNVSGMRHETMWETLDRLPHTRLGKLSNCATHEALMELCDGYNPAEMEFFFDRQSRSFSSILSFYQTGRLHLAEDVCILSFKEDLEYWNIDEQYLQSCCQHKYHRRLEKIRKEADSLLEPAVEDFGAGRCAMWRHKLWDLMEKPQPSCAARLPAFVSISFIVVWTITLAIGTIPSLQGRDVNGNATGNEHLAVIEALCIGWFTLEYVLLFWASPSKLVFLKGVLNAIDLLVIVSFYISLIPIEALRRFSGVGLSLQMLKILRLLKLTRYSTGMQSLGCAIKRSSRELVLMLMCFVIGVVVFSSLVYFAESEEHYRFLSIPDAFWWAAVTMTTVGYGDMIPITGFGKLVGVACCLCGILVIVLPIPIIVNNFTECYKHQMLREKALKRHDALELAKRSGKIVSFSAVDLDCGASGGAGNSGGRDPGSAQVESSPPKLASSASSNELNVSRKDDP